MNASKGLFITVLNAGGDTGLYGLYMSHESCDTCDLTRCHETLSDTLFTGLIPVYAC